MHLFCSSLNTAMSKNFVFFDICKKKKYLDILILLKKYNCINSFFVFKNYIRIFFRYFNNKPIFFLNLISKGSFNKYFSYKKINKISNNINFNMYSSTLGLISTEECILLKSGGKAILQINFFSKNF